MTDSDISVQALIDTMLREPNPTRQSKLIEELGNRRITAAVEPLMQQVLLNTFQSGAAITALGKIGDARAVGVLIKSCRYANLAWIAKDALVQIGARSVEPLIAALGHDNPDIRFIVVRALGELCDPGAIEPLETMIEAENDETNRQFARSTLKNLLLNSLACPAADVRVQAVHGLDRLGDARTIEALQAAADHDPDEIIRQAAQRTIVRLLQNVETDPFATSQPSLRSRDTNLMINTLQRTAGWQAADLADDTGLIAALQGAASIFPDDAVRELARQTLWQLCIDYLRQPDADARLIAVQALGWFTDPAAARTLQQIAEHDPNETVRQTAREALSH
jgi:HEAT repeat protein